MEINRINLTEREMLIAKIGLLQGCVVFGKQSRKKALEILLKQAQKHGIWMDEALRLENTIDDMFTEDNLT